MLIIPTLRVEQMELAPLAESHSAGMFELWSDIRVCQYSGPVKDYDGQEIAMPAASALESNRIIDFWQRAAGDGWGFRWAVMWPGGTGEPQFAGTVGFNALGQRAEIAWHLLPMFWGRGVMSNACRHAIAWLADTGSTELEAYIEEANTASIRLAERLGMQATGYASEGANQYLMRLRR